MMNRTGEEKKDDKGGVASPTVDFEGNVFDNESEDGEEESDFHVLPSDVAALVGGADRRYKDEKELQEVFDQNGLGDLNVVLVDGEARLVMVKHQHNLFTSEYLQDLIESHGKWMKISGTNHVEIGVQGEKRIRQPDLNFWSYKRLVYDAIAKKKILPTDSEIPDVVVQFSWRNTKGYERGAIDDLMRYGLDREGGQVSQQYPRLGYLIKVKMSRKRTLVGGIMTYDLEGVHVYRQPHGTTMADAEASRNGAKSWYYCPTDPQFSREVVVTITAGDIGITGLEAWYFEKTVGNIELKISDVFSRMNHNQIKRQNRGLKY